MTEPVERIDAVVRGVVQGVGFRYFVLRRANGLGLSGWVANEADGSVRCVAEGPAPALESLLEALHEGPRGARVDGVSVRREPATGRGGGFSVKPSGHRGD